MADIESAVKALGTVIVSKTKELKGVSTPPALSTTDFPNNPTL